MKQARRRKVVSIWLIFKNPNYVVAGPAPAAIHNFVPGVN